MSGRSAYVRKKITETKKDDGHIKQTQPKGLDLVSELAAVPAFDPYRQGYGSSSSRSFKYNDHDRANGVVSPTSSQERESLDGRKAEAMASRPLDDFAYARARKPTIKPEDMSGIAKSGVRNAMDRKSEDIRKGLSKAFGFGSKKGNRSEVAEKAVEARPDSASTVRLHTGRGPADDSQHSIYELPGDNAGPPSMPPPTANLPPLPGPMVRRWIGSGRPVQRWNKLRKDPELWDPNGDVLVYLAAKGQSPRPDPSLRLSSHVIESTDSRQLITMLREGAVDDEVPFSPSHHGGRDSNGPASPSEASALIADGQISYEIYFPPPANVSKLDQVRHQLTSRNVFAVLCHVSLVGLSLHQALSDLLARLDLYMGHGQSDNVLTIMSYLCARGIDDVRNDAETAVGLLAWSEDPKVRWEEAWRESFVHAAGLYGTGLGRALIESCADYKNLSAITRALLERASLETQLRVQAAEERLAGFNFGDMWPVSISMTPTASGGLLATPAKEAADRLQRFFLEHYRNAFGGRWPPPPTTAGSAEDVQSGAPADTAVWLTRTVTKTLQKDFGALYDYLVNRDIIWDMSESRASRKWLMVSESGNRAFEADTSDLPMTDILIEFDNRQRFPHIPHPYPLVPETIPTQQSFTSSATSPLGSPVNTPTGGMGFLKRSRNNTGADQPDLVSSTGASNPRPNGNAAVERRIQLAYTESTNIYILGSDFIQSDLIDAFVRFEKTDRIGELDPSLARRARWVLLYGILQTLASVSVDSPSIRHSDGVSYHLSPQLKGARIPPWGKKPSRHAATGGAISSSRALDAVHELSHCWVAPQLWTASNTSASDASNDEDYENDDISSLPAQRSPPELGLGFPYPPSSATSSSPRKTVRTPTFSVISSATDSAHSDATTWLQSASTTRATTPSTTAMATFPSVALNGKGSRKGLSGRSARWEEGNGDWEDSASVRRRDNSGAPSEASGSASGRRRRKERQVTEEILEGSGRRKAAARAVSPGPSVGEDLHRPGEELVVSDEEAARIALESLVRAGDRPLLRLSIGSSVAPVIKDFDALGVDDIMP